MVTSPPMTCSWCTWSRSAWVAGSHVLTLDDAQYMGINLRETKRRRRGFRQVAGRFSVEDTCSSSSN
eukprot:45067-Eustigmatos_ZCMA.PRE.1